MQPLRALTNKFYVYAFFDEFVLIYPLYTLLIADRGISPAHITILLVVWSAVAFLLEVPSGAIADKFSRKYVLLWAIFLRAVCFGLWLVMPSFWGFLAGFALWGVSSALTSGTEEALLYDELARIKQTSAYAKIVGRTESLKLVGVIAAGFAASALAGFGYSFMLVCSVAACVVAALPIALLPKSKAIETTGETGYVAYLKEGVRDAFAKPVVLLAVLFLSVVTGLTASDEYHSLLLREKGFGNSGVAFWTAAISALGIVGSLFAHKLERRKLPLELLLVAWAGLLLAAALLGGIATPLLLGLFMMVYYCIKVLFTTYLQHAVSDKTRATTTSVSGFLSELFALGAFAVVGFTAGKGYSYGMAVLACVVVAAAATLWLLGRFIARKYSVDKLGL